MELLTALTTVAEDIRASYPHLSTPLAIKHALDTTSAAELNLDDPTAPAYQAVHAASTAELILAIANRDGIFLYRGKVWEENGVTEIDGMDPFEWLDAIHYLD